MSQPTKRFRSTALRPAAAVSSIPFEDRFGRRRAAVALLLLSALFLSARPGGSQRFRPAADPGAADSEIGRFDPSDKDFEKEAPPAVEAFSDGAATDRTTEPALRPRPALEPQRLAEQLRAYHDPGPKTILELQPFRHQTSIKVRDRAGQRGRATLINLNPTINVWYLLRLRWPADDGDRTYHLESSDPTGQDLVLESSHPYGLVIAQKSGRTPCDLWSAEAAVSIETAAASGSTYVHLCADALALRNETDGHQTAKERVTDFLRDNVWFGEQLTVFVRKNLFQDAYLTTSENGPAESRPAGAIDDGPGNGREAPDVPAPARVSCNDPGRCSHATEIGIGLGGEGRDRLDTGRWYPAEENPGVFVSAMEPGLVSPALLRSHRGAVDKLDEVEAEALAYLVAFDLDRFGVGYALGTDHPRTGWSQRALDAVREAAIPGPDGIADIAPLVATGMINPAVRSRVAATFTAGFKRSHGAFKWSELARENHGSHYGFIENGVVLSKLQPGLATVVVYGDGSLDLKTWSEADDDRLRQVRFARQNGVPILELDEASGKGVPGNKVNRWGAGNWSGSQDEKLRSLRAGLCLQESGGKRFLIYGYFSSATPSAMARAFQAYDCGYAMHLDMNALEHTYLALYQGSGPELVTEHLAAGMEVVDKSHRGRSVPRFLGYADNRDFFYLVRRQDAEWTG